MQSYHNDPLVKEKFVNRMLAHMNADELIRGISWINGRGCAIGCTLNKYSHEDFETELGFPIWLAHLEDTLFENVSLEYSKTFPLRLLEAIPVGLSEIEFNKIKAQFLSFSLERNKEHVEKLDISDKLKNDILYVTNQCLKVQEKIALSGEIDEKAVEAAAAAVWPIASIEAAIVVARSVEVAPWTEKWAAATVWSAWSTTEYEKFADKLIELFNEH